jgi:hypothetical protein
MTIPAAAAIGLLSGAVWGFVMGFAWEKSREAMRRRAEYRRRSAARFGRATYWHGENGVTHIDFQPDDRLMR